MKKQGINVPLIAAASVFVCIVALVTVLGIKAKTDSKVASSKKNTTEVTTSDTSTKVADSNSEFSFSEPLTDPAQEVITTLTNTSTTIAQATSGSNKTTAKAEETTKKQNTTNAPESTTAVQTTVVGGADVPVYDSEDLSNGSAIKDTNAGSNVALSNDMTFAGLYKLGYDVYGPKSFIFNDDTSPDCKQRKFGYNKFYDWGASLIDFSISTVRVKFTYNGKQYMIQMWKGQYISGDIGTVGGEVGLYTRDPSKKYTSSHYDCAPESEWLNCEMTIYWDENGDGNYIPQFTRKYSTHWWETGYVDGQLKNKKDSSPLRLMQRITFKDEAQAAAFESALIGKGFKQVSTFSPDSPDTVKRQGKDVIYIWQYIKE